MARRAYRPTVPFSVAMVLLLPVTIVSYGVEQKTFTAVENGIRFNGSFRTFGGTDREVNGLFVVENTATIETWFRPEIRSDCRIYVPQTDTVYEIIGEPENIELRNQYLRIRCRAVKGGA